MQKYMENGKLTNGLHTFTFEGKDVRVVVENDRFLFVAVDICNILGYTNLSQTLKRLGNLVADGVADGVISNYPIPDKKGRSQPTNMLTEAGFESLILGSKKANARHFATWAEQEIIAKCGNLHIQVFENQSFEFSFEGIVIRSKMDDWGMCWFMARDVCEALDLENITNALKRLDGDEVISINSIDGLGRNQMARFVSESGLYALVLGSRKQTAKNFKKWVTSEVLPTLRKTGKYEMPTEEDFDENGTAITMKGAVQKMDYEAQAATTFLQIIRECVGQELATFQRKEFGDLKYILSRKQEESEERLMKVINNLAQKVGKDLNLPPLEEGYYVYLLRNMSETSLIAGVHKCKVGKSNDPAHRKFELELGGSRLELLEEIWFPNEATALLWERTLKLFFHDYRIDREWFWLPAQHIDFFKALAKCVANLYA